jgi:hypothetical protein
MEAIGILILAAGVFLCGTSVESNVIYGLIAMIAGAGIIYIARNKMRRKSSV